MVNLHLKIRFTEMVSARHKRVVVESRSVSEPQRKP